MRSRSILPVLCVAATSTFFGCRIPTRNNPNDPANAPAAQLKLVDATTGVVNVELTAPWGHELVFDATESTDNQGPNDIDHCVFTVTRTTSGSLVGDPWETDCYGEFHDSPFGVPLALGVGTSYSVQVRVVDSDGNFDVAPRSGDAPRKLRLTNTEPVADPGISRTLPVGGLPWNPGQPISLVFDGTGSYDADGDPLVYCWTVTSAGTAGAESCSATDPTASIDVIPSQYAGIALTAELRVLDPLGYASRTRTARVAFRTPNVWALPTGPGAIERMDTLHRTGIWGDSNSYIAVTEVPDTGQVVIVADVQDLDDSGIRPNEMYVVRPPLPRKSACTQNPGDCRTAPGIDLAGTGFVRLAADPRAGQHRVWLRSTNAPAASFQSVDTSNCILDCSFLSSYLIAADGSVTPERLVDIPLELSENGGRDGGRVFVDEGGVVFVANDLSAQVVVVEPDGTVTTDLLAAGPGAIATAIAPRPGTNETWILVSYGFEPTSSEPAELRIFEGAATLRTATVEDEDIPFGIGWVDTEEFWLGRPGVGLARFNAARIDEQTLSGVVRLEESLLQLVEEILDVGTMVVNRVSGDLWYAGLSGGLVRVSAADGAITGYTLQSDGAAPAFVDSVGALWDSPRERLSQAFAPAIDGVVADLVLRPGNMVEYDWETGGIWFPTAIPPGLLRAAEDGTVIHRESAVEIDGVVQSLPFAHLFRLTPGTKTGWFGGVSFSGPTPVYRIDDVSASPLVLTQILTAGDLVDIVDNGRVFEPFAPVPGDPARLWTVKSGAIVLLESDGSPAGVSIALPAAEIDPVTSLPYRVRAARSLENNDLCIASETATFEIHVRRISPSGSVTELATFPAGDRNEVLSAVAATEDPVEGPLCWVAWSGFVMAESAHIRAYPSSGIPIATYDTDAAALPFGELSSSILPISTGTVWATFDRSPDGSFERPTWKVELVLATSGNATLSAATSFVPTSAVLLAAPWTRADQQGPF